MVRQARTYFLGAMSGTVLIVAAVVVFVVLVSAQALRHWPLSGFGGEGSDRVKVAPAVPAGKAVATTGPALAAGVGVRPKRAGGRRGGGSTREVGTVDSHGTVDAVGSDQVPGGTITGSAGGESSPAGDGNSSPSAGGGGSPSGSSSSGGSAGGGSGSGSSGSKSGPRNSGSGSVSSEVGTTVNKTVSGVDKATGGALESTGVTNTTEAVVEVVAGPESKIGQTVDKTVEAVGGLLKPHH